MPDFGDWTYTCDREATVDAYARVTDGGTASCGCNTCSNFIAARDRVFTESFLEALDELGVDPTKDGEIHHNGATRSGLHCYGGWYHFVGTLEPGEPHPVDFGNGLTSYLCPASAPRLATLRDLPVVQLEIFTERVPWVLDEEEPRYRHGHAIS